MICSNPFSTNYHLSPTWDIGSHPIPSFPRECVIFSLGLLGSDSSITHNLSFPHPLSNPSYFLVLLCYCRRQAKILGAMDDSSASYIHMVRTFTTLHYIVVFFYTLLVIRFFHLEYSCRIPNISTYKVFDPSF